MRVLYCDRCGQEIAGPLAKARFIAVQEEDGLVSKGWVGVNKVPASLGTQFSLIGKSARMLEICSKCGDSLRQWLANP